MSFLCRSGLVCSAFVVLVSCRPAQGLPAQEVLDRSARASRELPSASFTVNATFTDSSPSGVTGAVNAQGRMEQGGRQMEWTADAQGTAAGGAGSFQWHAVVSVLVAAENEVYLLVRDLSADPPQPLLGTPLLQQFLGKWWRLPSRGSSPGVATVTPDPQLLVLQTQVIDVTRDRGLQTVHGRNAYHYDVAINHEKLFTFLLNIAKQRNQAVDASSLKASADAVDATGELWIDAETFSVLEVRWNLASHAGDHPLQVTFTMVVTPSSSAQPIQPPPDAVLLPVNPFGTDGPLLSPGAAVPFPSLMPSAGMDPSAPSSAFPTSDRG